MSNEATGERELIITLRGGKRWVRFPGYSDEFYFVIDDGGGNLADPEPEVELREAVTDEEGELDLRRSRLVMRVSGGQFVDRCVAQVRDFRVMVNDGEGNVTAATFNKNNHGDNKHNRAIYAALTDTPDCKFRTILLGAMDQMAGRTSPFQEAFEELFAEHPSLLSAS